MKPIGGAIWLVPLAVGCMALPPQSQAHSNPNPNQNPNPNPNPNPNSKSSDKPKQSKVPLNFGNNESNVSVIAWKSGNDARENAIETTGSSSSSIDVDVVELADNATLSDPPQFRPVGISAIGNAPITTPLSSSPSAFASALPFADRNSAAEIVQLSATSSLPLPSIVESKTDAGTSTTSSRGVSTTARTTVTAKTSATPPAAVNSSSSNTGSSASPTEPSSRTIASDQDASTFLSSTKKPTSSFNEFTTTPAAISSKETRESTGKIRPQIKLTTNYTSLTETGVRLPEGASAALAKPTKYHYYPHNQHIYLLPECAVQQVCNAVYVRLNFTQPLCACPGRYRDPCSASLDSDDLHTTELVTDPRTKALTLVKTCEPVAEMRECRTPRDWSLLALQNVRTGKSHYLVICRCPDANILEGPMSHDQPTYASVPGIRVYGMMCVQGNRRGRPLRYTRSLSDRSQRERSQDEEDSKERLSFPWYKVQQLMDTATWD